MARVCVETSNAIDSDGDVSGKFEVSYDFNVADVAKLVDWLGEKIEESEFVASASDRTGAPGDKPIREALAKLLLLFGPAVIEKLINKIK